MTVVTGMRRDTLIGAPRAFPPSQTDQSMLDRHLRPLIDPPLNLLGRRIARHGVSANAVTLAGLALGVGAAGAIWFEAYLVAIALICLSRLADGLDGAVARVDGVTDFGGYLDITCDTAFWGMIPLAFIALDPGAHGVAGAVLILSFYINQSSFLGFAILAERRGMHTRTQGVKSLYYTSGLLEGTETILFFIILCLLPGWFIPLAYGFAALTVVTAVARVWLAGRLFGGAP